MRVRVVSQGWTGAPGLNTFYFKAGPSEDPSEPTLTEVDLALTRVHAAFASIVSGFPPAWTAVVDPQVDVIEAGTGALVDSITGTTPATVTGTSASTFGPIVVMGLLQLRTTVFSDGSNIRGRAFIGPWANYTDTNGTPGIQVTTGLATMAGELQDAGPGGVPVLAVWRRPRLADPDHLPSPITARVGSAANVSSITVPDKWAVLRSRRD